MWPVLPEEVLAGFQTEYGDPLKLSCAFDDLDMASDLVFALFPDAVPEQIADWAAILETWRVDNQRNFKRARLERVSAVRFRLPHPDAMTVGDSFAHITQTSSLCVLDFIAKKRMKGYRDEAPDARTRRFEQERKKYSRLLANAIREARLPVAQLVQTLDDPDSAWIHIFAARRANTLKNRYKAWKPFRDWLELHRGRCFPTSVRDPIDYVQHRVDDGCGKTIPESVHLALGLIEQVGKVPEHDRISSDELWKSHVKSWTAELCEEAPPRRPAEMYTVVMLIALEIFVMDDSLRLFDRALAWVVLCMVWGAMRCDDVQAVIPSRMVFSNYGLRLVLGKSKTSGPDKRQKEVSVHIHRSISLTGHDWLREGFDIWDSEPFSFRRDFLVMEPVKDFSGGRRKFLPPDGLSSLILKLLSDLPVPRKTNGGWELNRSILLLPDGLESFFSGHSPRNFLTSVAAVVGFSKDERAYLGRWSMGMVSSEEYVRTSRQIVFKIQKEVNRALVEGAPNPYLEDETIDRLLQAAESRGMNAARLKRRHVVLNPVFGLGGVYPTLVPRDDRWEWVDDEKDAGDLTDRVDKHRLASNSAAQVVTKFFITISRRAGFRRLHLVGCFVKPDRCCEVLYTNEVTLEDFDSVCRTCKRKMLAEGGKELQAESSSTASSSSTDTSGPE